MSFGWINGVAAGIVVLMLIPNIVYAIKNRDEKNLCTNRVMNGIEQVGRYACIVLMWLPLLVRKFGFHSVLEMLLYLLGNCALLIAYWIVFFLHMRKRSTASALTLAILPSCIFLMSGVLLRHPLLMGFAALFAVGHIWVTLYNARREPCNRF